VPPVLEVAAQTLPKNKKEKEEGQKQIESGSGGGKRSRKEKIRTPRLTRNRDADDGDRGFGCEMMSLAVVCWVQALKRVTDKVSDWGRREERGSGRNGGGTHSTAERVCNEKLGKEKTVQKQDFVGPQIGDMLFCRRFQK